MGPMGTLSVRVHPCWELMLYLSYALKFSKLGEVLTQTLEMISIVEKQFHLWKETLALNGSTVLVKRDPT